MDVVTASGVDVTITTLRYNQGTAHVYTLTVAHNHTFFVGAAGVLVHNCDSQPFDEASAIASARRAFNRLKNRQTYGRNLATSEHGPIYASGGSGGVGPYKQDPNGVKSVAAAIGYPIPPHKYDTPSISYYGVHAEQYVSVNARNQPIGSTGIPCAEGCIPWFRALAQSRDYPQVVADPFGVTIFWPDGSVKRMFPTGSVKSFGPTEPIMPGDLRWP